MTTKRICDRCGEVIGDRYVTIDVHDNNYREALQALERKEPMPELARNVHFDLHSACYVAEYKAVLEP